MIELTDSMRRVLGSLDAEDGAPVHIYHQSTIRALMRRGRVELSHDGKRVFLPSHEHVFTTTMHMDGCHWYSTAAQCKCGAGYVFRGERSVALDPYSAIWMEPDFKENGCSRCAALMRGARPIYDVEITRPRGAVTA